jgi:hypothetical protein
MPTRLLPIAAARARIALSRRQPAEYAKRKTVIETGKISAD